MYEQPYNPYENNLSIVKNYFKSNSVLILAILRAAAIIISIVLSIIVAMQLPAFIRSIEASILSFMSNTGAPGELISSTSELFYQADGIINSVVGSISTSSIISTITSQIVPGLIAIATFIIYFKSRNESPLSSPKAGVTILYVLSVIFLVITIIACVAVGLVIVCLFWLYFQLGGRRSSIILTPDQFGSVNLTLEPELLLIFTIIITVIALIGMVIALLVATTRKRYFKSIKDSITGVELKNRGAKGYGIFCIIGAIFSGMSLLSTPSSFVFLKGMPSMLVTVIIFSTVIQLISFVGLIFEAKIALGYKTHIDNMKYGYNGATPVSPAAPYTPYVPTAAPVTDNYSADQNPYTSAPVYEQPQSNDSYRSEFAGYDRVPTYEEPAPAVPVPVEEPAPEVTAPAEEPAVSVCPACGEPTEPGAPFCGNCGNKL